VKNGPPPGPIDHKAKEPEYPEEALSEEEKSRGLLRAGASAGIVKHIKKMQVRVTEEVKENAYEGELTEPMHIQGDSVYGAEFENDPGQKEQPAMRGAADDWSQLDTALQATKKRDLRLEETSKMDMTQKGRITCGRVEKWSSIHRGSTRKTSRSGTTGSSWAPHPGKKKRHRCKRSRLAQLWRLEHELTTAHHKWKVALWRWVN
jgi:hypothetical protein